MDGPEKCPRVVTGNTPNKLREKRACNENKLADIYNAQGTGGQRPAQRMLAFQGKGKSFATGTMIYLDLLSI